MPLTHQMPPTLADFEKGHELPAVAFTLSDTWVAEYVAAVEDEAIGAANGFVPPMSLAALAVRALLEQAALPPGSIHVGQELAFKRPVAVGESLTVRADVVSRGERQGWVLMGVGFGVEDGSGMRVMDGRATITFPSGSAVEARQ